jgi:hypothetical protein
VGNLREEDHLEDVGRNGRIILYGILRKLTYLKITVFLDVTLCGAVDVYYCLRELMLP